MLSISKNQRTIAIFGILLLALIVAPSAQSYPYGVSGVQDAGCTCHGQSTSAEVVPVLEGLPTELEAGGTYLLNISFTGGPSGDNPEALALGGFHLWASAGTLMNVDEMVKINPDGSATHNGIDATDSGQGNDQTEWQVEWTAPMDGGAKFILHTNSVNGDGTSGGDMYNRLNAEVGPQPVEQARGLTVLASAIFLMAAITFGCVAWVFYRRSGPGAFEWEKFWPFVSDYLTSTDHKKVGTLYMINGLFFLGVGGIFALIFRLQLASPGNDFLTQDEYNQFFTLHGTTMIFLAAMPMIAGFANWIVPLQIGAPDLALPRLNALAFWLNPAAALLIFTGVFSGQGADTGWTGYAPYVVSNTAHSGATMWVAGQILLVASSTVAGINFMTTFCTMRAPGMGWMQMPLFSWSCLLYTSPSPRDRG